MVHQRLGGRTYLVDRPAPEGHVSVTTQLCNAQGCGDFRLAGLAMVAVDEAFYVVATGSASASRVWSDALDARVRLTTLVYSDGRRAADAVCSGIGLCATGNPDPSTALRFTVTA